MPYPATIDIPGTLQQVLLSGSAFFACTDYYTPANTNNAFSIFNPSTSGKTLFVYSLKLICTASGQPIRSRITTTDPAYANALTAATFLAGNALVGGGNSVIASVTYATATTNPPALSSSSIAYDCTTNATTAPIDIFANNVGLGLQAGRGLAVYLPNTAAGNIGFVCKWVEF